MFSRSARELRKLTGDHIPTIDYKGPDEKPMHEGIKGGLVGAGSLGCLVPLLLAIFCAVVLNDMGGPLFWPIIIIFGAVAGFPIGAVVGGMVRVVRRRRAGGA